MSNLKRLFLPCSIGDGLDRLSILQIKIEQIVDKEGRAHVMNEYHHMLAALQEQGYAEACESPLYKELLKINRALWDVENAVRATRNSAAWMEHALKVAPFNDIRASIKGGINRAYASEFVEVKNHPGVK